MATSLRSARSGTTKTAENLDFGCVVTDDRGQNGQNVSDGAGVALSGAERQARYLARRLAGVEAAERTRDDLLTLARLVLDVRDHGGLARAQRAARRVIEHYQRRRDDG